MSEFSRSEARAEPAFEPRPDADLIEYVVVSAASPEGLADLVPRVVDLVDSGAIRLIDVVVLRRLDDQVAVTTSEPGELEEMRALADLADHRVRLSDHDVELAAATLEPRGNALVLLVEDRWVDLLARAARAAGGRLAGGERVVRDRFLAACDSETGQRPGEPPPTAAGARTGRGDLLARSPQLTGPAGLASVDQVAQLRTLSSLVDRGVLSLDQYEVQRRRALDD